MLAVTHNPDMEIFAGHTPLKYKSLLIVISLLDFYFGVV